MQALFVSDLHLDPARPAATEAFLHFLEHGTAGISRLYVLGDLFEAWVRDDDPDPHHARVLKALHDVSKRGVQTYFMRGNRDFLIGEELLAAHGVTLLPDPTLISIGGESVLISHGDLFCTDDVSYQRFRRFTRHPLTLSIYHTLPVSLQTAIVAGARNKSRTSTADKPPDIMDVNQHAVLAACRGFGVDTLLHGHTHRQAIHELDIDGHAGRRIVLGDWYESGSALLWDAQGPRTVPVTF